MEDRPLYLRPDVIAEPLVDQWYAWPHLISPATACRNITHRHLPIIDSYISSPTTHRKAATNPSLRGGPFMHYESDRASEVSVLRSRTVADRADMIALSVAIDELDRLIQARAGGGSLEPLYGEIPERLKGLVELVYDLHDNPSVRFIEPLLYRSELHDVRSQSVSLSLVNDDARAFMFSTPRLDDDTSLRLPVAFDDRGLDVLFATARSPRTFAEIKDALDLPDELDDRLLDHLTGDPPRRHVPYDGPGARIRYFGHACVLVESASETILVDPFITPRPRGGLPRYTYEDVPDRLDLVLITHAHHDHLLLEPLLRLRHRIGCIVVPRSGSGALQDPSPKLMLESIGFPNVIELNEMDELRTDGGSITAIPFLGEHGDLNVAAKMAWRVVAAGTSVLFAADSRNISPELYARVHRTIGDVDVLFVGMECDGAPLTWIYGPYYSAALPRDRARSRRLAGSDDEQAIDVVAALGCRRAYVYAMGLEPWTEFVTSTSYTEESGPIAASNRLVAACRQRGIVADRLFGSHEVVL